MIVKPYREMTAEEIYIHVILFRGGIIKGCKDIGLNSETWRQAKYLYLNEVKIQNDESIYSAYCRASGNFNSVQKNTKVRKWDTPIAKQITANISHATKQLVSMGLTNPEVWLRNFNKMPYNRNMRMKALLVHQAFMINGEPNNYLTLRGLEADRELNPDAILTEDEIQRYLKGIKTWN